MLYITIKPRLHQLTHILPAPRGSRESPPASNQKIKRGFFFHSLCLPGLPSVPQFIPIPFPPFLLLFLAPIPSPTKLFPFLFQLDQPVVVASQLDFFFVAHCLAGWSSYAANHTPLGIINEDSPSFILLVSS
jgi:hypothetical protein